MRKVLYEYIFEKESYCQITSLDFFKVKQAETKSLMENIAKAQEKEKKGSLTTNYEKIMMDLEKLKGFVFVDESGGVDDMFKKIMSRHQELTEK